MITLQKSELAGQIGHFENEVLSHVKTDPATNSVGCYMLCLFAHPVECCCMFLRVVMQSLKLVKLLATCKQRKNSQYVGSCRVHLHIHVTLVFSLFLTKTCHFHGDHLEVE